MHMRSFTYKNIFTGSAIASTSEPHLTVKDTDKISEFVSNGIAVVSSDVNTSMMLHKTSIAPSVHGKI